MYQNIPIEIKPSKTSVMTTFSNSFNPEFSLLLRERRSPNLTSMQIFTIEVESNRGVKFKKKKKEEKFPSTSNQQSSKDKNDEMRKMIKI